MKKFGLETAKSKITLFAIHVKVAKDEEGKSVDISTYRSMIGSLLYLTASTPDITHSVGEILRTGRATPEVTSFCIVSWFIKKQNFVSLSSAEAEYIVAGSSCTQLLWVKQMLEEYGVKQSVMTLYCDNMSVISISKNPVQHNRTKHIYIRHHFIRELVEEKVINFTTTKKNLDVTRKTT
ncbi:hypothetical protein LIER_19473 [Lithospermum erythrorhizon]|uniref:Gag-pol polyprotein n=1 Tax=Lithospermum erythrorhizon TaxID=34254 RepID=A0AAV3QK73_LITER